MKLVMALSLLCLFFLSHRPVNRDVIGMSIISEEFEEANNTRLIILLFDKCMNSNKSPHFSKSYRISEPSMICTHLHHGVSTITCSMLCHLLPPDGHLISAMH